MNPDDIDRNRYRRWLEAAGRGDLNTCPCGQPAEDLVVGPVRLPAGYGFCPRHRFDLTGTSREDMAQWIIAGTFSEADLTEERRAPRASEGKPPFDA